MPINWHKIFSPELPFLEIIARGSIIYLGLFCMLRLVLKRQAGTLGLTDLLVISLMADAAQNAMAANYQSLSDGLLLVSTLVFWNFALEWLGYRFHWVGVSIHPPPLLLVKNGRMILHNMKKELISEDELMSQLREFGVEKIQQVKQACLEGNGKISVVKKDK